MGILNIFKSLLGHTGGKKKRRGGKKNTKKRTSRSKSKRSPRTSKSRKKVAPKTYTNKKSRMKKPKPLKKKKVQTQKKKISISATKSYKKPAKKARETEVGIVTHYFNKISVAVVKLKAPLKIGDKVRIKGKRDEFTQIVSSMQINHQPVSYASRGAEIGLKVKQKVHENDKVYKIS